MAVRYKLDNKPVRMNKVIALVDGKFGKGTLAARALEGVRKAARNMFFKDVIAVDGHVIELEFN